MGITILGTDAKGRQVTVEINGSDTKITTRGYAGRDCQIATAGLEAALGVKTADTPTNDHGTVDAAQTVKQS